MTLEEKFKKIIEKPFEINELEKITDDYAIDFLNYYLHNKANSRYIFSNLSAEESLEKFKQEKGYDTNN